jgi:hypothetical protein
MNRDGFDGDEDANIDETLNNDYLEDLSDNLKLNNKLTEDSNQKNKNRPEKNLNKDCDLCKNAIM